jgi:hypothetical protein
VSGKWDIGWSRSGEAPVGESLRSLTLAEWVLREEELGLLGPLEGEISDWIAQLWTKPIQFDRRDPSRHDEAAIQREVLRESFAIMADPRDQNEKQFTDLLGDISLGETHRIMAAVQKGDISALNKVRSEIVQKLIPKFTKQITQENVASFSALVKRCRAGRAVALCLVLYKEHPLSPIARARAGDQRAVLNLIKIDKLFLSDSCTTQVLRQAELGCDRKFLSQLAKALTYKPKTGWRTVCRLYLYFLFILEPRFPTLPILQLRLDPEETRFRSFPAFEKFVERCRKEFGRLQATLSDNLEQKA